MYMGDPAFGFDDMGELPHQQMQRLETYIERQRRIEAERILNARVGGVAPSAPAEAPAVAACNGPQSLMGRTTVLMPQIYGQWLNTPQVTMPYVRRQQLRNYPYAGAAVF